ncbi:MAG: DUF5103 domain-containing protein [Bacteroidetes bacterium]|jgi:hypothetical protein|nr:DUF5103 domain-containing protein [Bacteroidota bacterium]
MNFNKIYFSFLFLLLAFRLLSQDDYVNDNQMRYEDWTYKPYIKTAQLHESTFDANPAILRFNGTEQLELSFDDLEADKKDYSIAFVHCDANWEPSNLMSSEFMNGFYEANILNFNFSTNTIQKYTHYSILFPQSNMQFSKTGNYMVFVYQDNDKEKIIITKRFMIYEDKVTVVANVRQAIGNDEQYEKQHIDFNIINSQYELTNPFTDMKVIITQNNRWDNAVNNIKPTFTEPRQLTYSLDDKSTFNGGNEFRFFDSRSLRTYTERVANITRDSSYTYHIELKTDELRTFKSYSFYNDLNGGFLIKNQDLATNPDIEADYAWIHFFLPYDTQTSGNFYVLGKLTEWRLNKSNRMTYNYKKMGYECDLFVKQGYYNYTYVFLADEKKAADETLSEGNHWETENDYTIYVYHRQRGTYYDQLVAIKRFNSFRR